MNGFFFLNCSFTLITIFLPFCRFTFSSVYWVDLGVKFAFFLLIVGWSFVRGRKSIEIKKGYLYCNSYPFYRRFLLSEVSKVTADNKKVVVLLKDNSSFEVDYFFGFKDAISTEVKDRFLTKI